MSTKVFFMLVAGVLVIGAGVGGAVIAATSLGESDSAAPAQAGLTAPSSSSVGQQSSNQVSQARLDETAQPSSPQIAPGGDQLFNRGAVLIGTVEKIESNALTVNTTEGSLLATVAADASIQMFAEVAPADLELGTQVTVIGDRGEDGLIEARSIQVIPEGEDGLFGGRAFLGGGPGGDGQQLPPQLSQEQQDQLRQRFQEQFGQGGGNQPGQEQRDRLLQQFQGAEGQGAGGGGGLTGTIKGIDGSIITIETPRGPLQAAIVEDTIIQKFSTGTLSDLPVGAQVRLVGQQPEEGGTFEASAVIMIPEGGFNPFGEQDGFPGGFRTPGSAAAP